PKEHPMSRSSLQLSRRRLLAAMGVGATGAGLAACGAPAGGDDGDGSIRDGFTQADLTVPPEYEGRTPILFWAPFTGVHFAVLSRLFTVCSESHEAPGGVGTAGG